MWFMEWIRSRLVFNLLDPSHLELPSRKDQNLLARGTVAKVNLALVALPSFPFTVGASGRMIPNARLRDDSHVARKSIYLSGPTTLRSMEKISERALFEVTIPTILDLRWRRCETCAVLRMLQFAPFKWKEGVGARGAKSW